MYFEWIYLFIGTVYKAKQISVCEWPFSRNRWLLYFFVKTSRSCPGSATSARPNFYAIKCINRKSLTKTTQDLLINEIKLLKRIKHENIVEMFDFQVNKILKQLSF